MSWKIYKPKVVKKKTKALPEPPKVLENAISSIKKELEENKKEET